MLYQCNHAYVISRLETKRNRLMRFQRNVQIFVCNSLPLSISRRNGSNCEPIREWIVAIRPDDACLPARFDCVHDFSSCETSCARSGKNILARSLDSSNFACLRSLPRFFPKRIKEIFAARLLLRKCEKCERNQRAIVNNYLYIYITSIFYVTLFYNL